VRLFLTRFQLYLPFWHQYGIAIFREISFKRPLSCACGPDPNVLKGIVLGSWWHIAHAPSWYTARLAREVVVLNGPRRRRLCAFMNKHYKPASSSTSSPARDLMAWPFWYSSKLWRCFTALKDKFCHPSKILLFATRIIMRGKCFLNDFLRLTPPLVPYLIPVLLFK